MWQSIDEGISDLSVLESDHSDDQADCELTNSTIPDSDWSPALSPQSLPGRGLKEESLDPVWSTAARDVRAAFDSYSHSMAFDTSGCCTESGSITDCVDGVKGSSNCLMVGVLDNHLAAWPFPDGVAGGVRIEPGDTESCYCPHKAACLLPHITLVEQARDQLKLICMQAQIGYVLLGLLGHQRLSDFGYPHQSVIRILHQVLDAARCQVLEESYLCSAECLELEDSLDQTQLVYRLIRLRIHVLRVNVSKLLAICVPSRDTWREFGWRGKTLDEILDELCHADIPDYQQQARKAD